MTARAAVAATLVVATLSAAAAAQRAPDVEAILTHLDDLYRSTSSIARIEMIVTTPRSTRTLRLKAWTRGEDDALIVVEAPARE